VTEKSQTTFSFTHDDLRNTKKENGKSKLKNKPGGGISLIFYFWHCFQKITKKLTPRNQKKKYWAALDGKTIIENGLLMMVRASKTFSPIMLSKNRR